MVIRHVAPPVVLVRWSVDGPPGRSSHPFVRQVVAEASGCDPADVEVHQRCEHCGGPHGRPTVEVDRGGVLHVSVARADALLVVAVGRRPVGVDVERMGAGRSLGPDVVLSPAERARSAPPDLLQQWVRKEAVLKATGHGLRVDATQVTLDPDAARVTGWSGPGRRPVAWLRDLDHPGHVITVAGLGRRVARIDLSEVGAQHRAPTGRTGR